MEKQAVLVASFDPNLADVRKHALESAGYLVVPAPDLLAVRSGCELGMIALVVIGYSLPPNEKRRVWNEIRQVCGKATPILELYSHGFTSENWGAVTIQL
jgi:DNA-binding response OmpR family regulator